MANTHEHLEHAEHAAHHDPDPFAMRVAVSMAIIAAILAGLSMVGHRTHNKVLQLLGEANRLKTEAATAEVEKSNLFAWYQAKRQRQSVYQGYPELAALLKPELAKEAEEAAKKVKEDRAKKAAEPKSAEPKESGGDKKRPKLPTLESWANQVAEYNDPADPDSLPNIRKKGDAAGDKAKDLKDKADKAKDEAEHVHHQADRLDLAHLLAEIGLVICSVAVLTKKKGFWYAGIVAAVLALGTGASAYMIPHHPHEPGTSQSEKH